MRYSNNVSEKISIKYEKKMAFLILRSMLGSFDKHFLQLVHEMAGGNVKMMRRVPMPL